MKKLLIYLIPCLLVISAIAKESKNNTTLILASMSTLENAHTFIETNIPDPQRNIFIFKSGEYYIVTYGVYDSRKEARLSVDTLPMNLQQLGSFTKVVENDLKSEKHNIETLLYDYTVLEKEIAHSKIREMLNLKSTPLKKY